MQKKDLEVFTIIVWIFIYLINLSWDVKVEWEKQESEIFQLVPFYKRWQKRKVMQACCLKAANLIIV